MRDETKSCFPSEKCPQTIFWKVCMRCADATLIKSNSIGNVRTRNQSKSVEAESDVEDHGEDVLIQRSEHETLRPERIEGVLVKVEESLR